MSKDYQGAIAVFKDYVDFHDCHSQQCPSIGKEAIGLLQELVDKEINCNAQRTFRIVINEKDEVSEFDYEEFPIKDFIRDSGNDISLLPFYVSVIERGDKQDIAISRTYFPYAKLHYAFKCVGKEISSISVCKRAGNENLTISDSRKKAKDLGYDGVFTHAQYSALWILEAFLNKNVTRKDGPLFKDLGLRSGSSWEWFDGIYIKGSSLFVSSDESSDPKPEKMLIDSVKANYDYCSFRVDEDGLLVPDKKGDKVSVYLPINDPGVVTLAGGDGLNSGIAGLFVWDCSIGWGSGPWGLGLRPFKVCFKEEK